tara:strand:+ start:1317 stop:2075 length:759 start_codon:yes stop_codon:yes gene_type:complete
MLQKFIISLFILATYSFNSFAMVSFSLNDAPFINSLMVEDNLMAIQDKNKDFIILYNKKNEMVYIKHKDLDKTFKTPADKVRQTKFLTMLKPENTELEIINFNTKLYNIKFGGRECLQLHTAKDLDPGSGLSSVFVLYKAFVYFTGQARLNAKCENLNISTNFDKAGFPLAASNNGYQIKISKMENAEQSMQEFLNSNNLTPKKASKPNLNLQYHLMLSLLTEKQQETFLVQSKNKPLNIKIKAIDNLLAGF